MDATPDICISNHLLTAVLPAGGKGAHRRCFEIVGVFTRAESYGYDNNGNPTSFTDRKSQATATTYDALDRPTLVTYADSSTTSYTYDAGNRVTQIVDSVDGTITFTYDGLDRLLTETTSLGTVTYTYDAVGRRRR